MNSDFIVALLSKMAAPFRIVFLSFIASFFLLGLFDVLTNFEQNGCEMTYMYEGPTYIPVPLPKDIQKRFPRYKLIIYGEGSYREELRKKIEVKGIPVLFIPGNAGSHRQVRSLASVAYQKAKTTPFHFNYFALDLNEELSGLYGGILEDQTAFAHECIKYILSLYSAASNKPKSVVLVGHSMGGMIARAVFTQPSFDPALVHTIITQATPHQGPVVSLDMYLVQFYAKVNDYWQTHNATTLKEVTVFSSGGGFRDILVRTGLTSLKGIVPLERGLSSLTMSVPRAWVSTDHLCHVWCKQVVLATKRAMFDIVDKKNHKIAVNPVVRMKTFRHHFDWNPGPKHYKAGYDGIIKVEPSIKWEARKKTSWKFSRDSVAATRYSMMELPRDSDHAFVAITNIPNEAWVGTCALKPKEEKCQELTNLAPWAQVIPPLYSERKVVHAEPEKLLMNTHLIVILPKSKSPVEVMVEVYNQTTRHFEYELPGVTSLFNSQPNKAGGPEIIVDETEANALFYNISLKGVDVVPQAFTAHLVVKECKEQVSGGFAGSLMKFHVPWSRENTYSFIRQGQSGNISIKLQTARPPGYPYNAELHLYLHPSCTYRVVMTHSWLELVGQFVRFYGVYLPSFMVIQVLMTLSWQLKQLDEEGTAPSFQFSHGRWAQPWRVVPVAMLLRFMLSYPEESSLAAKLGLPPDDTASLARQGIWVLPMPIGLYLIAYAVVELYSYFLHLVVMVMGRISGTICNSCCTSAGVRRLMSGLQYPIFLLAFGLSMFVSGSLGIVVLYMLYLAKIVANYAAARRKEDSLGPFAWNQFNVNFSLFLLLLTLQIINAPSLIMWFKNLSYDPVLTHDPARITGMTLSVVFMFLVFTDFPTPITELYGMAASVFYMTCVLMVLYTIESAYRVVYFVCADLVILAVPLVILVTLSHATTARQGRKEDLNQEEGPSLKGKEKLS